MLKNAGKIVQAALFGGFACKFHLNGTEGALNLWASILPLGIYRVAGIPCVTLIVFANTRSHPSTSRAAGNTHEGRIYDVCWYG